MAALTEEQKLLVVTRLAAFITPTEVLKELKLRYGAEPTLQQLGAYDPGTAAGKRLSKELKSVFDQTRESYLSDISDIPIAHQAGRLRLLDGIAREARAKGNFRMALDAAEQAAKDLGGMFLNKLDPKLLSDDQLCRVLGLPPPEADRRSPEARTDPATGDTSLGTHKREPV